MSGFLPTPNSLPTSHTRAHTHTQTADAYTLTPEEIAAYKRDGYLRLPGFLTGAEVEELEAVFDKCVHVCVFVRRLSVRPFGRSVGSAQEWNRRGRYRPSPIPEYIHIHIK